MSDSEVRPALLTSLGIALVAGLVGWYPAGQGSAAAIVVGVRAIREAAEEDGDRLTFGLGVAAIALGSVGLIYPLALLARIVGCATVQHPLPAFLVVASPAPLTASAVALALSRLPGWIRYTGLVALVVLAIAATAGALFIVLLAGIAEC